MGTSSEVTEVQVRHYETSDGGTGSGDRETPTGTIYEVNNNRIQAWIVYGRHRAVRQQKEVKDDSQISGCVVSWGCCSLKQGTVEEKQVR